MHIQRREKYITSGVVETNRMYGTLSLLWLCFFLSAPTTHIISASPPNDPYATFLDQLPCVKHGRPMRFLCTNYQYLRPTTDAPDCSDAFGRSWIHRATICGDLEELQSAISKGINITHTDNKALSPLHYAVHAPNSWEIVCLLLPHYSDDQYDAPDKYGMTPLAYMMLFDKPAAAAELFNRGACLQRSIAAGITITGIVTHLNNQACLTLIKECVKETKAGDHFKSKTNELQNLFESIKINMPGDLVGLILSMIPCDLRKNYRKIQPNTAIAQ